MSSISRPPPIRLAWLLVAGVACHGGDGGSEEEVPVRLYGEALRVGKLDGEGPELLASVASLRRDEAGRIYVLEQQAREIRVFDPDGRFLRSIGAPGSGPGELRTPIGMAWDPAGNLWVVDPGNARYSIYDTAGSHIVDRPRRLSGYVMPWLGGFTPAGRLWEIVNTYVPGELELVQLVGLDDRLEPRDTIPLGPVEEEFFEFRPGFREHVPFTPYLSLAFDPSGSVWVGDATEYELVRLSLAGDTLQRIRRTYDPVPVTEAERDSAWSRLGPYREAGGRVDVSAFPDVKPAFDALSVDRAGRLWVHLVIANDAAVPPEVTEFDVFEPAGEFSGRVRMPVRLEMFTPPPLVGEVIHAVTRDSFGVPFVVVLEPMGASESIPPSG